MQFGVSYFGVRDPRHAARDLDEIAEAGFRSITHTFSEHDLRYHQEDVGRLVEASRERGLEVGLDPWGVGGLFGGEAPDTATSPIAIDHSIVFLMATSSVERVALGAFLYIICGTTPFPRRVVAGIHRLPTRA